MIIRRLRDRYRREGGQAIIIVVLALVVLLGMAGLAIDVGRIYVAQRQLQQAVDAAGLVAGQDLPNSTQAATDAVALSATQGNSHGDMIADNPTITFECNAFASTNGAPCQSDTSPTQGTKCRPTVAGATVAAPINVPLTGPSTPDTNGVCNAVKVTEGARINTTFLSLFTPSLSSVSASSTVAAHGGVPHPIDIMLILDTTGSTGPPNLAQPGVCTVPNATKLDCEKQGAMTLLKNLWPCNPGNVCDPSANPPVDKVGLMVDPAVKSSSYVSGGLEYDCGIDLPNNGVGYDDSTTTTVTGTLTAGTNTVTKLSSAPTTIIAGSGSNLGSEVISTTSGTPPTLNVPLNTTVQTYNAAAKTLTMTKNANVTGAKSITFDNRTVDPTSNTNDGNWTYLVAPLESNYSNWDPNANGGSGGFVLTQPIVTNTPSVAVTGDPLIQSLQTGNCGIEPGGDTSFATVIDQAQTLLFNLHDGHQHIIIFLSDGGGNYGPVYYSADTSFNPIDTPPSPYRSYPCQQAVANANSIAQSGVLIYSIAYWQNNNADPNTQCNGLTPGTPANPPRNHHTDNAGTTGQFDSLDLEAVAPGGLYPNENAADTNLPSFCNVATNPITACWTMYNMASDPSKFFPDPSTSSPTGSLNDIFKSVALDVTDSRIIPGG